MPNPTQIVFLIDDKGIEYICYACQLIFFNDQTIVAMVWE